MTYHYSTTMTGTHAKAVGRSLPISFKEAVVASHELRGMQLSSAKRLLSRIIAQRQPLRYFRFHHNTGHRTGAHGPGRYPINTCKGILALLESAEANASHKGMQTTNLTITHILAQKGSINWRMGRKRVRGKRTHVEIILTESPAPAKTQRKPFIKPSRQTPAATHPAEAHP